MLGAYTGSTSVKSGLKWPWLCCSCVKFCSVDCDIFVYLHVTGSAGIFLGTFFFFFLHKQFTSKILNMHHRQ